MANKIVFKYDEMDSVVKKINQYAGDYEAAADKFKTDMESATTSWEGESKNKFTHLVEGSVYDYMKKSVPEMVRGLAKLLENNLNTMSDADAEIAKNIPNSI